jgi:hypothetical protein
MRNKHILDKMKAMSIIDDVNNYRQSWLQHIKRMDSVMIPKQIFCYIPTGQRLPGRPKRRWLETITGYYVLEWKMMTIQYKSMKLLALYIFSLSVSISYNYS